jgi:hypothetical protein
LIVGLQAQPLELIRRAEFAVLLGEENFQSDTASALAMLGATLVPPAAQPAMS